MPKRCRKIGHTSTWLSVDVTAWTVRIARMMGAEIRRQYVR